jgi:choice-of-anchor A domain-containing protein
VHTAYLTVLMRSFLNFSVSVAMLLFAASSQAGFTADPLYQDTIGPNIHVGKASLFSVLSFGDLNQYDNTVTGPSIVRGNVGIGGNGNFSMSDGDLYGDLYVHQGAKVAFSGPAKLHGNQYTFADNNSSPINMALQDAWSLSAKAAAETATGPGSYSVTQGIFNGNTFNSSQSASIFSTGRVVLNLQDFVMTSGTFTLQGTATTTYIINVSRNFSLNNSSIQLSGLVSSQVLFNVKGTGSQVSLNQGTSMGGILLATQRKVDLSGGKVFGRVIANQVNITSGGQVVSQ